MSWPNRATNWRGGRSPNTARPSESHRRASAGHISGRSWPVQKVGPCNRFPIVSRRRLIGRKTMHRMERFSASDWHALAIVLEEIVGKEDKNEPVSDDALVDELAKRGFKIERRTVTRLRKRLGIPSSRQRSTCRTTAP